MDDKLLQPVKIEKKEPLDCPYSFMLKRSTKDILEQMKTFEDYDVPGWIRNMIEDGLKRMGKL